MSISLYTNNYIEPLWTVNLELHKSCIFSNLLLIVKLRRGSILSKFMKLAIIGTDENEM